MTVTAIGGTCTSFDINGLSLITTVTEAPLFYWPIHAAQLVCAPPEEWFLTYPSGASFEFHQAGPNVPSVMQ